MKSISHYFQERLKHLAKTTEIWLVECTVDNPLPPPPKGYYTLRSSKRRAFVPLTPEGKIPQEVDWKKAIYQDLPSDARQASVCQPV